MSNRKTREISIGILKIGGSQPVLLQSMCATKTTDISATARTAERLAEAGAGLVRVAVDNKRDAEALREIASQTAANLSVDLHENYRLAELVAPYVKKIRYNPGRLHYVEPQISWKEKVRRIADVAAEFGCALRVGVNCGSIDPEQLSRQDTRLSRQDTQLARQETRPDNREKCSDGQDSLQRDCAVDSVIDSMPLLASALEHSAFLDSLGFMNYCVSLKSSDPATVICVNREFAKRRPDTPIHLGLTEAGLPPEAVLKSRAALEPLLAEGIGDTLRVSLTVPNDRKQEEIQAGRLILDNVARGEILTPERLPQLLKTRLNIISCPSCSRVENGVFVELAERIREASRFAADFPVTIAVMGCRVNGPGETDNADIGIWCGASQANLKRGKTLVGTFDYEEIIPRLLEELRAKIKNSCDS
ncbi:MAG: flavodoxin-dependent (E)-4-hydroxy-3-methylbut-2-enyl-diphosphate synthase [Planctomycetaceae bacterium]|jgi:(E)-4-hydroxy-3-methylbut-2-enyl-diphosphate synthase|nr:flavodoxin-dependent (E)-4-hydroxy-3-methylbut-2-enyl-diphosphate synthase [Planctomycetaceae bacterium]